jgi:putative spermidine/putrescine transport system permease protein
MAGKAMSPRAAHWIYGGTLVAIYLFLLLPLVFIIAVSLNAGDTPTFPPTAMSLRWYAHALSDKSFIGGAITSGWLAAAATLITTPVGVAAAFGIWQGNFRGKELVETLFLAPLAVPGIALGIALLVAFAALEIREAPLRLLAAHVLLVLPYSIRTVLASLVRLEPALGEAALTLGASRWQTFYLVTLPLIKPGVAAGMAFAFILSFDDIAISLFLVDAKTSTLPVAILSYLQYNFDPSIAAISSISVLLTLAVAVLLERIFGLQKLLAV